MRVKAGKLKRYDQNELCEEDIYADGFADELLEDDALSAEEAAFIKGYTDS